MISATVDLINIVLQRSSSRTELNRAVSNGFATVTESRYKRLNQYNNVRITALKHGAIENMHLPLVQRHGGLQNGV
jgi:hypothetical protein